MVITQKVIKYILAIFEKLRIKHCKKLFKMQCIMALALHHTHLFHELRHVTGVYINIGVVFYEHFRPIRLIKVLLFTKQQQVWEPRVT